MATQGRGGPPIDALVTGGAGFIGSHLTDALVALGGRVRVLDDLSTGLRDNVHASAELIEGSISDVDTVAKAVAGCEVVFHLGAHGAVARSLANPLGSNEANVQGTLTVLTAARDAGVRRVVFASSSSVYGGAEIIPTPESAPLRPRSPYAVSKLAAEWYVRVFAELFPLETVALRYFNVFGPRQRPDSTYAAVIPLFADALLRNEPPTVHGDGRQSRDFTYVADVVAANLAAARAPADICSSHVYNVAPGTTNTLLDLLEILGELTGNRPAPSRVDSRAGDVQRSQADATAARADLGWSADWTFDAGLREVVTWMRAREQ
ncbi:MAG TPA: NAD-dependent epimerase/dehydratase family protein [Acidimicrobiia bacterium]